MEKDISIVESRGGFITPVADLSQALQRYQLMKDFIGNILRENVDFGIIPGTEKPTLFKPGAEKLSTFFGLFPTFQIVEKVLDWSGEQHAGEPFFYFHYRCSLIKNGVVVAEGEGSSNSWEKKYRWRDSKRACPVCGSHAIIKGKEEYGGGWICFAKMGGCGAKFSKNDPKIINQEIGQIKNPDIADIVNTLQKMGQKRSFVAAVLLAVNGSEYFNQDIEDFIDSTWIEKDEPAVEKPASRNPEKPVKEERPWKPDVLKKMLLAKAETKPAVPSTEQVQAIAACLEYILKSKGARYEFLSWVSGKPVKSSKDMDDNLLAALSAYLDPKYDKNGGVFYPKNENVTAEVTAAHTEYLKSIGQEELEEVVE